MTSLSAGGSAAAEMFVSCCSRPWVLWFWAAARWHPTTSMLSGSSRVAMRPCSGRGAAFRPRLSEPLLSLPFCGLWSVPCAETWSGLTH